MCRLIIVDDEEDVRYLMAQVLQRRGYEVDVVSSAVECLQRLAVSPATIVMTDVQMPGMSGLELCATIRDQYPWTAIIVMSGAVYKSVADDALECGAFAFLPKPVRLPVLEKTLAAAMAIGDGVRAATG